VTASWNTPVEQWLWQRRAAGELVAILAAHRDLPAVAWTVAAAGCTVAGQVNAAAAAGQVRATFAGWRAALGLHDGVGEYVGGAGTVYLYAMGDRNRVRVRLTATVFDDEPVQL
jgi:hypothetical protein